MKKFVTRFLYLIVGCLFLFGLSQGRLSDWAFYNYLVWAVWILCVGVLICFVGKRRGWWVALLILSLPWNVCAQSITGYWMPSSMGSVAETSISSYYKSYCEKIQTASENNWQGDAPCDEKQWQKAREISAQTPDVPPEPTDVCQCTNDYDCAVKLMPLCSQYEGRHPKKDVHTVLEILSNQESGCWPCDMAMIIFVVVQSLSFNLYDIMVDVAVTLLKLLFLGWITFAGLAAVVFPSEGMTFPKRTLQRLIVVMLTYLVLTTDGMTTLYNGVLNPVMSAGMGLSQEISDSSSAVLSDRTFNSLLGVSLTKAGETDYCRVANSFNPLLDTSQTVIPGGVNFSNTPRGKGPDIVLYNIGYTQEENLFANMSNLLGATWAQKLLPSSGKNNTLLNDSMKAKLLCMTQKFYHQSNPFIALGQSLVEFSTKDAEPYTLLWVVKPFGNLRIPTPFSMAVVGIIFVAVFTIFSFLIAFKIMDMFLRLAFFLVLMPLFVVALAFPATRDFTKKGWDFLLHTVLEFLALALAVAFIMQMMESFLGIDNTQLLTAMKADYSDDYGENLLNAVYTGGACRFLFGIIALCYFGWGILKKMTEIVDSVFDVKGVAGNSLVGAAIMSNVGKSYALLQTGADVMGHKKLQYQAPDAAKREEVKNLSKAAKKEQEKLDILQADAYSKNKRAQDLEKKAAGAGATDKDKEQARTARQQAQGAQKAADAQKAKVQELQNKILVAQKEASALRFPSSQSKFKARRYMDDSVSKAHYKMQRGAENIEKLGMTTGRLLNKTGIGAVAGVPLMLGTKALSMAWRAPTKIASMATHGVTAIAAGGTHSYNWVKKKLTGK